MRSGYVVRIAVILVLFGFATPVFAEAAKKEGDPSGAPSGEKKPEKDPTGFMGIKRYDLGIYTLIVFGGLVLILGKFAWKPVMQGLQKREDSIRSAHDAADKARADAQEAQAKLQKQLSEANDQVRALIEEARRDAQALKESMKAEAAKDIQAERERTKRELETAKDQALQEIWTQAVQLASLLSTKAIHREMTADDHRHLVDEALAELKQNIGKA